MGEELEAPADVDDGADEGGAGAEGAEREGEVVAYLEQDGADSEQREEGAPLSGPVGPDGDGDMKWRRMA